MVTGILSHTIILAFSAVVTASLAGYAWRRSEQSTRLFVALMIVFTVYSAAHLVGLFTLQESLRLLIDKFQWIATALVPLFWILFALEYTGADRVLTRKTIGLLSVIPALTILFAWTNPWHGLMWTQNTLEPVDGFGLLSQEFGPWFWVYAIYTYGIVLTGAVLLVRLVLVSENLYLDQSVLLIVGAAAPTVASVLTVLGVSPVQEPTLDMTPYAFMVSGLAFGYAIFRHRLFDMVPATRQLGRRSAIQDLEDGVVIVDTDQRLIYCNPAASALLDITPEEALGQSIRSLAGTESFDFDTDDVFARLDLDGSTYEVRTSPIYNRRDTLVGHTLIFSDITERRHRMRQLERQRNELQQLEELNSVLRGINRVLVSATTREEIEHAVCEHLAESELYQTTCIADMPTWDGDTDRWVVAGEECNPRELPAMFRSDDMPTGDEISTGVATTSTEEQGEWVVVPLRYRRTVYGVLGLYSHRKSLTDDTSREREILAELGSTIGHSISAVENRRLLKDETTIELKFRSRDESVPLLSAALEAECELDVRGVVPDGGHGPTAYVGVTGSPNQAADALEQSSSNTVKPVQTDDDEGLLKWKVPEQSLVGRLIRRNLSILHITSRDDCIECFVEVPSETEMRTLVNDIEQAFPETELEVKRQRELKQSFEQADGLFGTVVDELTDKQREALEAAYREGYFEWPRENSAEDVAETLDISRPTFQAHLRKAEDALLTVLFDPDDE